MKTISIINQEGGTEKTTTAINLGTALASLKRKYPSSPINQQAYRKANPFLFHLQ